MLWKPTALTVIQEPMCWRAFGSMQAPKPRKPPAVKQRNFGVGLVEPTPGFLAQAHFLKVRKYFAFLLVLVEAVFLWAHFMNAFHICGTFKRMVRNVYRALCEVF